MQADILYAPPHVTHQHPLNYAEVNAYARNNKTLFVFYLEKTVLYQANMFASAINLIIYNENLQWSRPPVFNRLPL